MVEFCQRILSMRYKKFIPVKNSVPQNNMKMISGLVEND